MRLAYRGRVKRPQRFIQHTKFAILDEMLGLFKRADLIQRFINKEKKSCWKVLNEICSGTNYSIQHFLASNTKNTCWIRLKWFTIQHLISNN